jgi:hypothetical protein
MISSLFRKIIPAFLVPMLFSPCAGGETINRAQYDGKFVLVVKGSWNYLNNKKLNNEYIYSGRYLDDKIHFGFGYSVELGYYIADKLSLGCGLIYLSGSSVGRDRPIIISAGSPDTDVINLADYVKTRIYAPALSLNYHIYTRRIDYVIALREAFLFGKASRLKNVFDYSLQTYVPLKNDYYAKGLGLEMGATAFVRIRKAVFLGLEFGLRLFRTRDLVENDTGNSFTINRGRTEPLHLDYSGAFISAGLMFRLF